MVPDEILDDEAIETTMVPKTKFEDEDEIETTMMPMVDDDMVSTYTVYRLDKETLASFGTFDSFLPGPGRNRV